MLIFQNWGVLDAQPTSVKEIPIKILVDGDIYSVDKVTVEKAGIFVNVTVDNFTSLQPLGGNVKLASNSGNFTYLCKL